MNRRLYTLLAALGVLLLSVPSLAATLSGQVVDDFGNARPSIEVRLWQVVDGKRWMPVKTETTSAAGNFSFFSVSAGRYLIDARMPNGVGTVPGGAINTVADSWVDIQAPMANGWAGYAADIIDVADTDNISSLNLTLLTQGGFKTVIRNNIEGIWVRVDNPNAPDFERTMMSNAYGGVGFTSVPYGEGFRVLAYDPQGRYATQVLRDRFNATIGSILTIPDIVLSPRLDDPNEPNNDPTRGQYTEVPSALFRTDPPGVYISEGAYIGPRGSDLDTYCLDAMPGERFKAFTVTTIEIDDLIYEIPWIDPMLRVITGDGRVLAESDDYPGAGLNAFVDTGMIQTAGLICFQVTTFGDTAWTGRNQQTAGDYTLIIEPGKRAPTMTIRIAGALAPKPPGAAIVSEGATLRVDIDARDPDNEPLTASVRHVDARDNLVETGTLSFDPGGIGYYMWDVPHDGARHAPYEIIFTVSNSEMSVEAKLIVSPRNENVPPEAPRLLEPTHGSTVATHTPTLKIENAYDADGDPLTYEFELYFGEMSGTPDIIGQIGGDPSGFTTYVTRPLPEDQLVSWRVRANDGALAGGLSPWSEAWNFFVNAENTPPLAPSLVKPDPGATVPLATPTLSASNATDADGDRLALIFEVATDANFEDIVRTSPPVEQSTVSERTSWNVEPPLEWGETYWARVYARDPGNAESPRSNVREFRIKNNLAPDLPTVGGDFGRTCRNVQFAEVGPDVLKIPAVHDSEGEALVIEVAIYPFGVAYEDQEPIFKKTINQQQGFTGEHTVQVDPTLFEQNTRYAVRIRATDSMHTTAWALCDFWVRGDNLPPEGLKILTPRDGEVLPERTTSVRIEIQNALDGNGDPLNIHWCAQLADDPVGCPDDEALWWKQPQSVNETTVFSIDDTFPGAEIILRARACDPHNACTSEDRVQFRVDKTRTAVTPSLCACDVVPGRRPDTAGWILMWGVVFFILRRRSRD